MTFAQSPTVLLPRGRLPPKHSLAHPLIAKPKRSLFTRKCGRMVQQTSGWSLANAPPAAGGRMPGWLGTGRMLRMFSTRRLIGMPIRRGRWGRGIISLSTLTLGRRNFVRPRRSSLKTNRTSSIPCRFLRLIGTLLSVGREFFIIEAADGKKRKYVRIR